MFISAPSVLRQWQRQGPPGRRSISHMVMVQPSGPSIHCGRYSGLVQASKTSRRGASSSRVMTISWSVGIVTVTVRVVMAALPWRRDIVLGTQAFLGSHARGTDVAG